MNWEAIGASAELLGAVAVAATLLYLTMQLRQNTKSINSNLSNTVMAGFNEMNIAMFSDPEVSRICHLGFFNTDSLSDEEKNRYSHMMNGFFNIYRNLYHQFLDGTYPEERWLPFAYEARQMMHTPGVDFFRSRTSTYEDLFGYLESLPEDGEQPLAGLLAQLQTQAGV